jgi:catechol 2,3-dioxygenase-like lactoylglutathione lyase family enzyme
MPIKSITPILNVSDIHASIAWFEKLGWQKGFEWGDPPSFGGVCSGDFSIFLCLDGQGGRDKDGSWMSIWVDDVDTIHRHCVDQGIEVTMPPTDEPWGVREMHVRHPDGHVLRIGQIEE